MDPFFGKRLSCGVIVLNDDAQLLLCHVTGQAHWDLPKGGIDDGETPLQAALRETREETGLLLDAQALLDLGRLPYRARKDLHLFATRVPGLDAASLWCESRFADGATGDRLPEMDGYGWFAFEQVAELCTRKLALVLRERLDLPSLWAALPAAQTPPPVQPVKSWPAVMPPAVATAARSPVLQPALA